MKLSSKLILILANITLTCLLISINPLMAKPPEKLVLGVVLEPPHLDPTAGAAAAIDEVVYANIFEGLTRIDENGEVKPGLALSWEISPDWKTYIFNLRQGVAFHDGTPLDYRDVIFSFNRAMAEGSINAQKALFEPIESIDGIDSYKVKINLKRPTPDFLFTLGWGDAVIVSTISADTNKTNPIGTGPFIFDSWVKGSKITLSANRNYWGWPEIPKLAEIEYRFIQDPAASFAALIAGDVDMLPNLQAIELVGLIKDNTSLEVHVGTTEGETILALNNARAPLNNPMVRQALSYAIDKNLVNLGTVSGYATLIGSHFSPLHPAYIDLTGRYPYNPKLAKTLLEQAGVKLPLKLEMKLPPTAYARRSGEIIAAQLNEIGVEVSIIPVEWAVWLDQVFTTKDYDMTIVSHTEPMDIGIYARDDYYFNYNSPDFKELYNKIKLTTDSAERNKLYKEAQILLSEDSVNVFLYQLPKIGVWNKRLAGVWINAPIQANDFTRAYWKDE